LYNKERIIRVVVGVEMINLFLFFIMGEKIGVLIFTLCVSVLASLIVFLFIVMMLQGVGKERRNNFIF